MNIAHMSGYSEVDVLTGKPAKDFYFTVFN